MKKIAQIPKFTERMKVNLQRTYTNVIAVFCCIFFLASLTRTPQDKNELVKQVYFRNLNDLEKSIQNFKSHCKNQMPGESLKKKFLFCRLIYKKMSPITDYFNIYETKSLNGPNLPRVEEDNPQTIIAPQGFQVLEELLFSHQKIPDYKLLASEADNILVICQRLKTEPDVIFKFKDNSVFDALRSAVLRIITLGISGFDSPVAQQSLPEAVATLEGIEMILNIYREDLKNKAPETGVFIFQKISEAKKNLQVNNNFNRFDRLAFIKKFANPIFTALVKAAEELKYETLAGRRPLNPIARTIFEKNTFLIDFFSPDEHYSVTDARVELGKKLFYDPILSGDQKRSCATCHKPEKAFTDGLKTALALDDKTSLARNTPTLWNSVFQTRQFFDSRTSILENQLDEVVHNKSEMKGSLKKSVDDLKRRPEYIALFSIAYPENKEQIVEYNIANAISSFVRSLVSLDSRFDQYMRGNETKMNAMEKTGFNLFMGKAKCGTCHFIPLFNGLIPPEFSETESEILGVPKTKNKAKPVLDPDLGKFGFTNSVIHKFAFKIPTLRNIELTAPYMHNGVFDTMEEVMDFYNNGGGSGLNIAPANQTLPPGKLNLSKKEIGDIIAFMKTLTDTASRSSD